MSRISLVHLITGTGTGGAELMLERLVSRIDRGSFDVRVISLTGVGEVGERMRLAATAVEGAGLRRGRLDPRAPWIVAGMLRGCADVVQTWMYHADLIGGFAARLAGRIPVAWNIRHSTLDPSRDRRTTILTARACALLSRAVPQAIVCCSNASKQTHERLGYDASKMIVIPNGFDTERFSPDPGARGRIRAELGIDPSAAVVGLVARLHPQKDHGTFLRAAGILLARRPGTRFVLCGEGVIPSDPSLARLLRDTGTGEAALLLGRRDDISALQAAFDVGASSAVGGEGFPNVIAEAMACGVPCVVTDVGDSEEIVGDTGIVVPAGDPEALAAGWERILSMPQAERARLGLAARGRIEERFDLASVTARYEELYRRLAAAGRRAAPRSTRPAAR